MKLTRKITWSVNYYVKFKPSPGIFYPVDSLLEAESLSDLKRQVSRIRTQFRKIPELIYLEFGETRFTILENHGKTFRDVKAQ
jgi:hypothetical protein